MGVLLAIRFRCDSLIVMFRRRIQIACKKYLPKRNVCGIFLPWGIAVNLNHGSYVSEGAWRAKGTGNTLNGSCSGYYHMRGSPAL